MTGDQVSFFPKLANHCSMTRNDSDPSDEVHYAT
jgi:hypothetical protein